LAVKVQSSIATLAFDVGGQLGAGVDDHISPAPPLSRSAVEDALAVCERFVFADAGDKGLGLRARSWRSPGS
jgi:hypothetical protein